MFNRPPMASMLQHLQPVNVGFQIQLPRYKDTFLWRYDMQLKVVTTNWLGLLYIHTYILWQRFQSFRIKIRGSIHTPGLIKRHKSKGFVPKNGRSLRKRFVSRFSSLISRQLLDTFNTLYNLL